MKTPEQIAHEILSPTIEDVGIAAPVNHSLIYRWIERAIEADRAQRDPNEDGTLHGAAIIALRERSYHAGDTAAGWRASDVAGWIESNPDDFWDEFAGPMLDAMEAEYGR